MEKTLLANGLGWAEGPTVLPDGRVCFVETFRSQVSVWDGEGGVRQYAYTAGGPNSCVVGASGELYVCQNGGTAGPWRAAEMVEPGIQRIERDGAKVETLLTSLDGTRLNGPNDLAFGPNGSLYITDPGTYRPEDPEPSNIFELKCDGSGTLLVQLDPPTFPNGIAVSASGDVVWAESYTGMICRYVVTTGQIENIARLPGDHPVADGLSVAADGRLLVTTVNGGGIDVFRADGTHEGNIEVAANPTNCVFDVMNESQLYVTTAGVVADSSAATYAGQLWALELPDATAGPVWRGSF